MQPTLWQQIYDPFGNMIISALLGAIPVVVMLVGLGFLHLKAPVAAGAGLAGGDCDCDFCLRHAGVDGWQCSAGRRPGDAAGVCGAIHLDGGEGSADLFIVARDHLARAVCGVGFLANIQIFAAKTALQPIPIQAPHIHTNKSALPEVTAGSAPGRSMKAKSPDWLPVSACAKPSFPRRRESSLQLRRLGLTGGSPPSRTGVNSRPLRRFFWLPLPPA